MTRWSDVQAEIKRAEQISRLAVGPSVNELRYAGRILVAAFVKELDQKPIPLNEKEEEDINSFTFSEKIAIADQYLINADNDISDSLFYFFQSRADDINGRYGSGAVVKRHEPYQAFLDDLKLSRDLIIESRRNVEKRKENYKKLKPIRERLISGYFDLQKSEALMAVELYKKDREIKRYQIISAVLVALVVAGVIFSFR